MLPLETRIESVLKELEKNISFVSRATLAVFEPENEKAVLYRKGRIKSPASTEKKIFPLKSVRSAEHLKPGKHLIVKDLRALKSLSETDRENLEDGICSYLSVPLFYRNELTGALFLCSDIPDPFSENDIELAKDVANSLTLALEQNKLEQSLIKKNAEKELLLKEIHHRVKNNLQVISSLLNLQSASFKDAEMLEAFQKSKDRIHAMALIHTKLYESGNLSEIIFEEYIQQLIASISASYSPEPGIKWEASAKEIKINVDISINLGLIITELVTNSLKHAFKEKKEGLIKIDLIALPDGKNQLTVADNGCGLPENFKYGQTNSLGLEIVGSLIEQIEGTLEINSENGTSFIIRFDNLQ
ncbi:MAG: GAF domain-containing protein [Bacteroidia bacterium]|nr:GAF domain-containing protein [Bacteroidia bacterium]